MPFKIGNKSGSKIFLGNTEINKAYLGSVLLFDKTSPPVQSLVTLVDGSWSFSIADIPSAMQTDINAVYKARLQIVRYPVFAQQRVTNRENFFGSISQYSSKGTPNYPSYLNDGYYSGTDKVIASIDITSFASSNFQNISGTAIDNWANDMVYYGAKPGNASIRDNMRPTANYQLNGYWYIRYAFALLVGDNMHVFTPVIKAHYAFDNQLAFPAQSNFLNGNLIDGEFIEF